MNSKTIVVQASSRSWQGSADLCLNPVDGVPAVLRTVQRFLALDPGVRVVLAAPAFDRGGVFDELFVQLDRSRFSILYACDDSPHRRLVEATLELAPEDCFVRVDGVHFGVLAEHVLEMLARARAEAWECLKFPDDYPIQLGADVYRVGALRELAGVPLDSALTVHPKYAMFEAVRGFRAGFSAPPEPADAYLNDVRRKAREVYFVRGDVTGERIASGDQLSFHYQLAVERLPRESATTRVLDIACGNGFGSRLLAQAGFEVLGGDLDPDIVAQARALSAQAPTCDRPAFRTLDVTDLDLPADSFDAVVSMETIEHVDDERFLRETKRVLRPGGTLILSTPQNSYGHIPVNPEHVREYSLVEIEARCGEFFDVQQALGIKQGRVVLPESPLGTNTVLTCRAA